MSGVPGAVVYLPDAEFDAATQPDAFMVILHRGVGAIAFAMVAWLLFVVFFVVLG